MNSVVRRIHELRGDLIRVRPLEMASFIRSLPRFFSARVSLEAAEAEVRRGIENRDANFLTMVRTRIQENAHSPYRKLFEITGCEIGDVEALVQTRGIEGALEELARGGVYLTSDEFKGRRDVVRGSRSFRAAPADFDRIGGLSGISYLSSGSRSEPVRSFVSLDWLTTRTPGMGMFFAAHDAFRYAHAVYDAIPPGAGVNHILQNAKLGHATERWFAQRIPSRNRVESAYFLLYTHLIVQTGRFFGPGFPAPQIIGVDDQDVVIRWIEEKRRKGMACYVTTVASAAARIAQRAWEQGVSLEGTKFCVAGEPLTAAKHAIIQRAGGVTTTRYSFSGAGNVGFGCGNPAHRDEVHVNQHLLTLIQRPDPLPGHNDPPIHPLLCTTVHPDAPRFMLNVENGDYGVLSERDCGCTLGQIGLKLHLHEIRSFEKLASEGMNYFFNDLLGLLETNIPDEFGGSPGAYQLVEEEDESGRTRLTLRVHPNVALLREEDQLLERIYEGLGQGARGNRFMSQVWADAGTVRISREAPYVTPRGKILPLHIPR